MGLKDSYLKSPDLLPISSGKRSISMKGFAVIWVGMAILLASFAIGAAGVINLPMPLVVLATFIGTVIVSILMVINGDVGVEHGLSFPVYMRAPFGTIGTHLPSFIRGVAAAAWFGINSYFGALAINGILNILIGYDNWFVCFLIFTSVQLLNTSLGIKSIERFADFAAPIIIAISIWMYLSLSASAKVEGKDIWSWVESPATGMTAFTAFMVVMMANMGFWSTLVTDMPTLTRFLKAPTNERGWFKRNRSQLVGTLIVLPLISTFMIVIGAVGYITANTTEPIAALQETSSGIVLVVLLVMIILAQWSTNTTANVIPAATIFSNIGGPKLPFWVGVVLTGVVGILIQPWSIFAALNASLVVIGSFFSPIVGIMICDYYIIRKRRINVQDLYKINGQFKYYKGINFAGMIAWIVGGIAALTFFTFSFIVGLLVSLVLYYILAKYWWFKIYLQAELVDPDDNKYLGITVGRDWEIPIDVPEVVGEPQVVISSSLEP